VANSKEVVRRKGGMKVTLSLTRGAKSTEFWLHMGLQIVLMLNTTNAWSYMPTKYSALVQGILYAAYAGSRGLAKFGTNSIPTNTIN
jgi:hypothetical protein